MSSSAPNPASAAAPSAAKICFNSQCKETVSDHPSRRNKGWCLRSGEIAELCSRCSCAFEQGTFCETFHSGVTGWRNCETCGKRLHCGCIVSAQTYVYLDAGGVECLACANKSVVKGPNQISPPPMLMQHALERRDSPTKTWRSVATPSYGQWRQAPHMWTMTNMQSDLQQRLSYEFDRPCTIERLATGRRHYISAHEKNYEPKRIISRSINSIPQDRYADGNTGENDPNSTNKPVTADPSTSFGFKFEAKPNSSTNLQPLPTNLQPLPTNLRPPSLSKENSSLVIGLPVPFSTLHGASCPINLSAKQSPAQVTSPLSNQFCPSHINEAGLQVQMRNGRTRGDAFPPTQLLPQNWPTITDQKLQEISGDRQTAIIPLFEKMLTASDVARIGRLVLPKKCAEVYFPTISQPEGLPLKVQDTSGRSWTFQFRFWPNNNSRMYVLEGVTPCIQAMQLQAGDTVTFSRIDPEGKLVMGFRKASCSSNEQSEAKIRNLQDPKTHNPGNDFSSPPEADQSTQPIHKDWSIARSPPVPSKRKAKTLGSKNKRLRIENEESMELKLTWEEAQKLLHPPPNSSPSVVVIEGHEFEEYEEAPILGKMSYFTSNQAGSACPQELDSESIADTIPCKTVGSKRSKANAQKDNVQASDRLDTLVSLAISKNLPAFQPTTKHPRHKPGCSCIVCIQPPSGQGPKHKPDCTCNVCLTVRRRFKTLESRREKRQSEKELETSEKQPLTTIRLPKVLPEAGNSNPPSDETASQRATMNVNAETSPLLPIKIPQIDLNIQPERDEEPSTASQADTSTIVSLFETGATRRTQELGEACQTKVRDATVR
ncbi:B3 domain-containing protein Os07g0563300-like isoform X2 [Zingiber officinale]|uniref:B3 domain-containing protein Os07g0563300-like isoform X2 n=1 Tax=Zingiber officinale TaxID=94328 RepID=UPI001C4B0321|nr:B3 domain-containing protein Os07g0563300-like isoform X2 [Zingiber officinale]